MKNTQRIWTLRKVWLVMLGLVGVGIAGCAVVSTTPSPSDSVPTQVPLPAAVVLPTAVPSGIWVQPGIAQMGVGPDGVWLAFACGDPLGRIATMILDQPLLLDSGGHFAAESTRLAWREGEGMSTPTRTSAETLLPFPHARLIGLTDGRTLALNIEIVEPESPSGEGALRTSYYGPYTLTLSQNDPPPLVQCTPPF